MDRHSAPITTVRRQMRRHRIPTLLLAFVSAVWALSPTTALAFDIIASGGLYNDGLGGYGIDGTADDTLWVGDGAGTAAAKTLPACTDSGGNHLNYDASTNTFSCGTSSSASTVARLQGFTTISPVDLNGNSVFISPTGNVSATEGNVARMPSPATGNLSNLRCSVDGNPGGTSLKVELAVGTCGSAITFDCTTGDLCVTLPAGATATSPDTDNVAITAGQCMVLKATAVGDTASSFIGCSWTLT